MNKIFRYKDIMEEMYEVFPDLEPKSLDAIIRKGLYTMKSELSKGEELLIHSASSYKDKEDYVSGWIKFYKEMPPARYKKYIERRNKKREVNNAKQDSSK